MPSKCSWMQINATWSDGCSFQINLVDMISRITHDVTWAIQLRWLASGYWLRKGIPENGRGGERRPEGRGSARLWTGDISDRDNEIDSVNYSVLSLRCRHSVVRFCIAYAISHIDYARSSLPKCKYNNGSFSFSRWRLLNRKDASWKF